MSVLNWFLLYHYELLVISAIGFILSTIWYLWTREKTELNTEEDDGVPVSEDFAHPEFQKPEITTDKPHLVKAATGATAVAAGAVLSGSLLKNESTEIKVEEPIEEFHESLKQVPDQSISDVTAAVKTEPPMLEPIQMSEHSPTQETTTQPETIENSSEFYKSFNEIEMPHVQEGAFSQKIEDKLIALEKSIKE